MEILGCTDFPGTWKIRKNAKMGGRSFEVGTYHKVTFVDLMAWYRTRPLENLQTLPSVSGNMRRFNKEVYQEGDEKWKGGSYSDLYKPSTDLTPVRRAEEKIKAEKIWKRVATTFAEASSRKRVRSAYDGEFDFDKRWDVEPFTRRQIAKRSTRIVKLYIQLSFSCSMSAEKINEYGAFVTAIISLLEKSGVLVEVHCLSMTEDNSPGQLGISSILIKKADEYLPLQSILKVFSANFFRRVLFGLVIAHADALKCDVDYFLGKPYAHGKVWEIRDKDKLCIYSVPEIKEQNEIIQKLVGFIEGVKDVAG